MQRIRAMRLHPAMWMTVAALPAPDAVTATKTKALRQIPPATTVRKSRTSRDRTATARARNHPGRRPPATTPAAPARSWTRTNAATTPASPANRGWTRPPRSWRGTRPCTRPRASPGRKANAPGAVEETIRQAHRSILDWRSLLRRYMTDAARRDYSWSVPNRRFIDSGLYLPSMHSVRIVRFGAPVQRPPISTCRPCRSACRYR